MSFALPLALAGAGGTVSGIADAVGKVIGDLELAISRFGSAIVRAFKSVLDKVLSLAVKIGKVFITFFRIAIRYIVLFLRYAYRYMASFYRTFQRDPWHTLQFIGSVAILINNSVFP
jgi:hypothetical protein